MKVGILALQGAVSPHVEKFKRLGVDTVEVRRAKHLENIAGMILPGGESTTMIHLLNVNNLWDPLKRYVESFPSWGICAGTILLAKEVCSPTQKSFAVLDVSVQRNGYGRQIESFVSTVHPTSEWIDSFPVEGVFIRSPKINESSKNVRVLFRHDERPVFVEQGNLIASTFHPELTDSDVFHRYFLKKCEKTCG